MDDKVRNAILAAPENGRNAWFKGFVKLSPLTERIRERGTKALKAPLAYNVYKMQTNLEGSVATAAAALSYHKQALEYEAIAILRYYEFQNFYTTLTQMQEAERPQQLGDQKSNAEEKWSALLKTQQAIEAEHNASNGPLNYFEKYEIIVDKNLLPNVADMVSRMLSLQRGLIDILKIDPPKFPVERERDWILGDCWEWLQLVSRMIDSYLSREVVMPYVDIGLISISSEAKEERVIDFDINVPDPRYNPFSVGRVVDAKLSITNTGSVPSASSDLGIRVIPPSQLQPMEANAADKEKWPASYMIVGKISPIVGGGPVGFPFGDAVRNFNPHGRWKVVITPYVVRAPQELQIIFSLAIAGVPSGL